MSPNLVHLTNSLSQVTRTKGAHLNYIRPKGNYMQVSQRNIRLTPHQLRLTVIRRSHRHSQLQRPILSEVLWHTRFGVIYRNAYRTRRHLNHRLQHFILRLTSPFRTTRGRVDLGLPTIVNRNGITTFRRRPRHTQSSLQLINVLLRPNSNATRFDGEVLLTHRTHLRLYRMGLPLSQGTHRDFTRTIRLTTRRTIILIVHDHHA